VLHVGDRCEVEPGAKRGTVKFVGHVEALGRGFGFVFNMISHLESTMACMFIPKPITLINNRPCISLNASPVVNYVKIKI
jgi:hypothetical protein